MAKRKREYVSKPVLRQEFEVKTELARRLLTRGVWNTAGALYRIETVWRMIGNDDEIDQIEQVIFSYLDKVTNELLSEKERLQTLLEQNSIREKPDYTQKTVVRVRILSPSISRYISLILMADELIQMLDALWLFGLITNRERKESLGKWINELRSLRRKIREIELKTRNLALSKGREVEDEQEEGIIEETGEMAAA